MAFLQPFRQVYILFKIALLAKTGKEVSVLKLAELDMEYVDTVLPRATYFDTNMVNSESDLTVKEYYLSMALAMVILLAGMAMAPVVSGHNRAFLQQVENVRSWLFT